MTRITLSRALNEGLRRSLETDPKVMIMGEDVGRLGGVFRVTDGLQKDFGEHRVVDTPLAEAGIVGQRLAQARIEGAGQGEHGRPGRRGHANDSLKAVNAVRSCDSRAVSPTKVFRNVSSSAGGGRA